MLLEEDSWKISNHLTLCVSKWFRSMLKLPPVSQALISTDASQSRSQAFRVALHSNVPDFNTIGYRALRQIPRIYLERRDAKEGLKLVLNFSLPESSLRFIDGENFMNSLNEAVKEDESDNSLFFPFFLLNKRPNEWKEDKSDKLVEFCDLHKIWLHVEGVSSVLLLASSTSSLVRSDSLSVSTGKALGIHRLRDFIAFFPRLERFPLSLSQFYESDVEENGGRLSSLPLWMILQRVGASYLNQRVEKTIFCLQSLQKSMEEAEGIEVYGGEASSLSVLFRFTLKNGAETPVLNQLNVQCVKEIKKRFQNPIGIDLEFRDSKQWICVRPLELGNVNKVEKLDGEELGRVVKRIVSLIESTTVQKEHFERISEQFSGLKSVEGSNFYGLGSLYFLPTFLAGESLSDDIKPEIDELNERIAKKLMEKDEIYSIGRDIYDNACINIGLDSLPFTPQSVDSHIKTVYAVANSTELSQKVTTKINEVIQKGIKLAEEQLWQQEANTLYQAGVLRHVPLVGSVYNWWNPITKKAPSGRSFHLASQSLKDSSESRKIFSASTSSLTSLVSEKAKEENRVQITTSGSSLGVALPTSSENATDKPLTLEDLEPSGKIEEVNPVSSLPQEKIEKVEKLEDEENSIVTLGNYRDENVSSVNDALTELARVEDDSSEGEEEEGIKVRN
eukprot:TRINITY_DN2350_c0_g1_i4.p1 TRINITY_DN2350_c0_g1~~TRINITY_DN2350_c0_g1_i4.p1  ORF type:complete len:772 (+),score=299.31 TRINITY_DN2350_c0_g1_i4:289-2316(+)